MHAIKATTGIDQIVAVVDVTFLIQKPTVNEKEYHCGKKSLALHSYVTTDGCHRIIDVSVGLPAAVS